MILSDNLIVDFVILFTILLVALLLNKYPRMWSGYLIIDLPIMLVVLIITLCFEVLVSILPDWTQRKQDLKGKLVLLTGAGSGIGRETSVELSRQGCTLILWDVNERGNEETARMIRESGGRAFVYTVDVSDREAVESAAESVIREQGPVDILVCNAGILNFNRLYKIEHHEIDRLMTINFISIIWLIKYFLNKMVDTGHIVCISSLNAMRGKTHSTDYSASKSALSTFCTVLMEELDLKNCKNVHISVIYPSFVDTALICRLKETAAKIPLISPSEVATSIVAGIRVKRQFIAIPPLVKLSAFVYFLTPVTFSNVLNQIAGVKKMEPLKTNETFS